MARNIFDTIVSVGGFSGEYEALTEAEISAASGSAYSPPEEFDNFRVVDTRVVQLLGGSPMFFETFQTSAFTLRVPSGQIANNDATDGRIYFIKNSGTGVVTVETSGVGTTGNNLISRIVPSRTNLILHADADEWAAANIASPPNTISSSTPLTSDDETKGYEIGSKWIDSTENTEYVCIDNSTGAAIWKETANVVGAGKQTPKEHFIGGTLLHYPASGSHPSGASAIQYSRVWLTAGLIVDRVRIFVDTGGLASRHFRVGLYNQSSPTSITGTPNTKLRESAELGTAAEGFLNGTFTNYVVPITGYYWIAFVADTTSIKFAVTPAVYRSGFAPVRSESTTGTTLPSTAGTLTNPSATIAYASLVEV